MSLPQATHPALRAFFDFTRARVNTEDIIQNVPGDPSAVAYFKLWNAIRRTGRIPDRMQIELSEVICLTAWTDAEGSGNPESFLAFRRFTNGVGLIFLHRGWTEGSCVPPPNYLACQLLTDRIPENGEYMNLLRTIFPVTSLFLKTDGEGKAEQPFFTLGEIILAQEAGDFAASGAAAARLIVEEEEVWMDAEVRLPCRHDGLFLFCLTHYSRSEQKWMGLISKLENPDNDPNLTQVRHLFAGGDR